VISEGDSGKGVSTSSIPTVALIQKAGMAFLTQVIGNGLKYLTHVFFARRMGSFGYGTYAYVIAWVQLLAVPAGLGLNLGVLRFVPQYLAHGEWRLLRGLLSRTRQLTLAVGLSFSILGSIFLLPLQSQRAEKITFIFGLWMIPLFALVNLQMEMIRGAQHIAWAYAPPLLIQPTLTILIAFLVLEVTGSAASFLVLGATVLALLVTLTVQIVGIRQTLPDAVVGGPSTYETSEWLRVSFPLLLVSGSLIVLNQADILLVGLFLGSKEAGIYTAVTKTATLVSFVLGAVNAIAAPMIASLHARHDYTNLQRLINSATHWMFWPSFALTVGMVVFSSPILSLFGPEFNAGNKALIILAIGQLINASAGPVGNVMNLTGHQVASAQVYGVSALLNIGLNALLVPRMGITGAALATTTTMVLWNVWLLILVQKRLGIHSSVFSALLVRGHQHES